MMCHRVRFLAVPLLALLCLATTPEARANGLSVDGVWARPTYGTAKVSAAYFEITNKGSRIVQLVSIESPAAANAELHTLVMDGDIARMRQVDSIDIAKGEAITFQPGGLHVMLMGVKESLIVGNSIDLTLNFAHRPPMSITAVIAVKPPTRARGSF